MNLLSTPPASVTSGSSPEQPQQPQKYACSLCARRKVKCNRTTPCANCQKAHVECVYESPALHRPRKRAADEDLLARLAGYEELMQKHNVDYSKHAQTWVSSGLESGIKDLEVGESPDSTNTDSTAVNSFPALSKNVSSSSSEFGGAMEKCLWATLPSELMYSPTQILRRKDDPFFFRHPTFQNAMQPNQPDLSTLHPEPKHIYRLWHVFVERINPLTKLIHVPTLQQKLLDASFHLDSVPPALVATMFSIYSCSAVALTNQECESIFQESRSELIVRWRDAALRALLHADFLSNQSLETLQAGLIFLFSNPESDISASIIGGLVRLAQRSSLHLDPALDGKNGNNSNLTVFEREMRIRVWWQLRALEGRICCALIPEFRIQSPVDAIGNLRLPLNISDTDLHPDMTNLPQEHIGHTEMSPLLMKFQLMYWFRWNSQAGKFFDAIVSKNDEELVAISFKDEAIDGLQKVYQEKFLKDIDMSIPSQRIIYCIGNLSISRLKFKVHHPRARMASLGPDEDLYIPQEEGELLFTSALTMMEIVQDIMNGSYSGHLFSHFSFWPLIEATVYVTSELRRRTSGEDVGKAWQLLEMLYETYPETIEDDEKPFFVSLGDLVLEAWNARHQQLLLEFGGEDIPVPAFVGRLKEKRHCNFPDSMQLPSMGNDGMGLSTTGIGLFDDWEYWSNFSTL